MDSIVGLEGVRADIAMMQTPDGTGRLELTKFHSPSIQGDNRHAPANTRGIRHLAFLVEDIYRLCYLRGPEGPSSSSRSGSANRPRSVQALRGVPGRHNARTFCERPRA